MYRVFVYVHVLSNQSELNAGTILTLLEMFVSYGYGPSSFQWTNLSGIAPSSSGPSVRRHSARGPASGLWSQRAITSVCVADVVLWHTSSYRFGNEDSTMWSVLSSGFRALSQKSLE